MLNIHTICGLRLLGESDGFGWLELIVPAIFIIGGFLINKLSESKKDKQLRQKQRERAAQRQESSVDDSPQEWQKVEATDQQRQEFLSQAKQRKQERKQRVKMLKRKLEEGVSDFAHVEHQPLPSEQRPEPTFVDASEPSFIHPEQVAVSQVSDKVPSLSPLHDSANCDTTHRLLKDTSYERVQEQTRTVEADLSGVEKLRQAVIFSEILGKPKALRAESGSWDI